MKAVIIAGGTPPSIELLKEEQKTSSLVICADRGADCAFQYRIAPDYILGDFDSINKKAFEYFSNSSCCIETYPKDKDYTDTELALQKALELGATAITFLGCTGTRLDHTIGNFGLLLKCLSCNVKAYIRDDNNLIQLINQPVTISGKEMETFSLLAYNSTVNNLCIAGAKYPINNYKLKIGDSLTVSNEFKKCDVHISFSDGTLILLRSID